MTTTTCTKEVQSRATTSLVSSATCNRVCSHTATNIRRFDSHLPSLQPGRDQFASRQPQPHQPPVPTKFTAAPRPASISPATYNRAYSHAATNNNRRIASHFQPSLNPQ